MTDKLCPREPDAWLSTVITDRGTKLQRLGLTRDEAEMANATPIPLYAAPAQEPEWDAPPPPMKVDGSGASIARYAAPAQELPIVGWMVGENPHNAAMYNASQGNDAQNAAIRWNRSITALVLHPAAPVPAPAQEPPFDPMPYPVPAQTIVETEVGSTFVIGGNVCPHCHRGGPARDVNEPEFCRHCGAGIGAYRRIGEGTCPECDPEGCAANAAARSTIPAPGASEDERLIADVREIACNSFAGYGDTLRKAAGRLTALREELARYKNDDEVRDMVLLQAEDFARDETRRAAIAEAECARLREQVAGLEKLLKLSKEEFGDEPWEPEPHSHFCSQCDRLIDRNRIIRAAIDRALSESPNAAIGKGKE